MLKPDSFEKMPTKDPLNEKQRNYYLDCIREEKAKMQVLVDESEAKCLRLQEQLEAEEKILRVRTKNRNQFLDEQERIRNFVIEEPKEEEEEIIITPEPLPEPTKDRYIIDKDKIPSDQVKSFEKWLAELNDKRDD